MKLFKLFKQTSKKDREHPKPPMNKSYMHQKLKENWHNLMDSKEKKMSRGSANIFKVYKCRCAWGNKQLWGNHDKGRNKPGRHQPKK